MTLDYGLDWEERFDPGRQHGTLRSYRQHRLGNNPLVDPWPTGYYRPRGLFRAHLGRGTSRADDERLLHPEPLISRVILRDALGNAAHFGDWTDAQTRQFKTLTHPGAFRQSLPRPRAAARIATLRRTLSRQLEVDNVRTPRLSSNSHFERPLLLPVRSGRLVSAFPLSFCATGEETPHPCPLLRLPHSVARTPRIPHSALRTSLTPRFPGWDAGRNG